ncbi:MAG: hypothetical protein DRG78_09325 [Epsilonproteobacteria bacterium]|nr:MAG: hypothetical protein DRG78_09325 [Campylobacterota bacterium]
MENKIIETEQVEQELTEQELKDKAVIDQIINDRKVIADKIDGKKVTDSILTIVQRAEMHSKVHGKDYYITTVENGIAFFDEDHYEQLTEKTILDLRTYLASRGIVDDAQEIEVDKYAANLVIHYIDFKSFSEEEVQSAREQFGTPQKEEKEEKEEKEDKEEVA